MSILPNYNEIVDLLKKGSNLEAQEKIMELREGALALQHENLKLHERINELEEELNLERVVQWEAPFYWKIIGETRDGPFCQKCYDSDRKLIRVLKTRGGWWHCKLCRNSYLGGSS